MDFIYLFRVILKRKWIIIGATIISVIAAYFLTRNQPKYYASRSQMSTGFSVSDEIKMNNADFDYFQAETKFNNAIATCKAPTVIFLVSYNLILHDLQENKPFRILTEEQKNSPQYKAINIQEAISVFMDKLESMTTLSYTLPKEKQLLDLLTLYKYDVKSLSNKLNVYRFERTDYIEFFFISENPELSAYVVNSLFKQFLRYYKSVRSDKSTESVDTLRSLMEKKKQELDQKNIQLSGEGVGLVEAGQGNSNKMDIVGELQKSLNDEKNNQITLYSSLRKVNQKLADLGSNKESNSGDPNELIVLRKQMNDAYNNYLNGAPSDKAGLWTKYNQLKSQYLSKYSSSNTTDDKAGNAKARNTLIEEKNGIQIDIDASNAKIETIQKQINQQRGIVINAASKGASVEAMIRERDLANAEYIDAKKKYTDALDINTSAVNNFRQVLIGQPSIDPEPSKRKLIIGLAGIITMLTVMLIFVIRALLDTSVKTPIIFSKTVNLKLISMVNFADLKNINLEEIVTHKDEIDAQRDNDRHNVFRESIRKLRFEIQNTGKKIFLFTSTRKGEGKTTLIQALSYSLSLSKKKILIIDTNFCNNDLTVQLHGDPVLEKIEPGGLSKTSIIEQVKNAATDVGNGSVFIIGSEGGDYTPSEILPRENLLQHLRELTTEYDYILLEGPPLNDFSDSKELGQYVDGVFAVFSADHIIKQIDKQSIRFFTELNEKFCGAILNMVDLNNVNVT